MEVTIYHVLFGIFGGLVRGLVGILKSVEMEKRKLDWFYFLFTLFVSALVGGIAGTLAAQTWQISFLAGYAGSDFIEGLYKIRFGQVFKMKV